MQLHSNPFSYVLLLFCLLSSKFAIAANCFELQIISTTGKPIANATVILQQSFVFVSDSLGKVSVCNENIRFPFQASISAEGFTKKVFEIDSATVSLVLAQTDTQLNDVTVMGEKGLEQRSAVSTVQIDKTEIAEHLPTHVGEMLQSKAGFTQRSGYQVPIVLRGLSGRTMLILHNGDRRFSSYPSGFMTHVINMYELDRIEVEKGAASVCYGEGAIAGIINLIDKSPFDSKTYEAKCATGYASNNKEYTAMASLGLCKNNIALRIGLNYRKASDFTYSNGMKAENSFYSDKNLFLTTGYKKNKHLVLFSSDLHSGGPWGKPRGFNGTKYLLANTLLENNFNAALHYSFSNNGLLRLCKLSLFAANESRNAQIRYFTAAGNYLSFNEITYYSDHYYGAKLQTQFAPHPRMNLRAGTEYYCFFISTPVESVDYIQGLEFQNKISQNARSHTFGVFVEDEFRVHEKFRLTAGMRFDKSFIYEGDAYVAMGKAEQNTSTQSISGNVSARWQLMHSSHLKLNVARAFSMPQATELFADSYTANGIVFSNPNLKPEQGYCFDLGYSLDKKRFNLVFSPYVWLLNNMISRKLLKGQMGTNYQYANIGKARLWGGEINLSIPFYSLIAANDRCMLRVGLSYCNGNDQTESNSFFNAGTPLDYIPPCNAKTELSYQSDQNKKFSFNLGLDCINYSEQTRKPAGAYATPAYMVWGCLMGIAANRWTTKPNFRVVVSNLTNENYFPYQSYLPAAGRSIRCNLSFIL